MTACAISMPEASTNNQPKNSIEATVAATERTTAAMPRIDTPIPNARNHPQYWTISCGIWTCTWPSPRFISVSSFERRLRARAPRPQGAGGSGRSGAWRAVGVLARQPGFERSLFRLIHGVERDDGCGCGVALGAVGPALQLQFFALGLPLGDFFLGGRLALFYPLFEVSLSGRHLRAILLHAVLDGVQMRPHVLLGGLLLAVDFLLQRLHLVVDAGELDAQIVTKL